MLPRSLRRIDVVALTINVIVGAGVFAMPSALAAGAGRYSLAVLLVAFVLVALLALSLVEVASRFDATGGPPLYAAAAFGPLAGFSIGWLMALSRVAAFAAILAIMLDYAAALVPALEVRAVRVATMTAVIAALAAINLHGAVQGASVSNLLTLAKLLALAPLALAGLWYMGWQSIPEQAVTDVPSLGQALLIALFACFGFEQSAVVAGEMRDPRKDLPVAIVAGIAIAGVLYLLLMLACFALVPDLAVSSRPLADAAQAISGPVGATFMAGAAVLSCAGGLSSSMLVSPRILYALSVADDLPRSLAAVHPTRGTPHVAIVVMALACWLLAVTGTFTYVAGLFVIARILVYASTSAALIVLRRERGSAPLPVRGGVAIACAALLCCLGVLLTVPIGSLQVVLLALGIGLAIRAAVRRRR